MTKERLYFKIKGMIIKRLYKPTPSINRLVKDKIKKEKDES